MLKNIFKEKGILNGKRVLALVSVLTFMSGTTFVVVAANHTWRSSGNVVYDENGQQNVLFNKEDLDYLDNRIDEIENNTTLIKESFANNLNSWSTDKTLNSTSTATEIEEVLNYIKSTPQEGEQCTDSSGNLCYLKPDGSVTTTVSEAATDENGSPIALYYSKATSDSMSAGTVAWVDGQVIVGNGENNKSYYNRGYSDGIEFLKNNAQIKYNYHVHTSDCYNQVAKTCYVSISYNGTFSQHCAGCQKDDPDATATFRRYVWTHSSCGAGQSSGSYCTRHSSSPSSYSHTYNENVCVCGKTEQTIESAELTF